MLMLTLKALDRNPSIDRKLKEMLLEKKANSRRYQSMYEVRKKLPSFRMQDQILKLIDKNQVVVISGETGKLKCCLTDLHFI